MSTSARPQRPSNPRHHSAATGNGPSRSGIVTDPTAGRTVFTYQYRPEPYRFRVKHDKRKHVLGIAGPDGETAEFEDGPVPFLVVERDPKTGEVRPCLAAGKPKVMLLCREAGP